MRGLHVGHAGILGLCSPYQGVTETPNGVRVGERLDVVIDAPTALCTVQHLYSHGQNVTSMASRRTFRPSSRVSQKPCLGSEPASRAYFVSHSCCSWLSTFFINTTPGANTVILSPAWPRLSHAIGLCASLTSPCMLRVCVLVN